MLSLSYFQSNTGFRLFVNQSINLDMGREVKREVLFGSFTEDKVLLRHLLQRMLITFSNFILHYFEQKFLNTEIKHHRLFRIIDNCSKSTVTLFLNLYFQFDDDTFWVACNCKIHYFLLLFSLSSCFRRVEEVWKWNLSPWANLSLLKAYLSLWCVGNYICLILFLRCLYEDALVV